MSDETKTPTGGHDTVGSTEPGVQRDSRLAGLRPPWPKGVSGNPGGRPKKKVITEAMEQLATEQVPREVLRRLRLPGLRADAKVTWAYVIARGIAISAAKGRAEACSVFADRLEGKVAQAITGADGTPLIPPTFAQAAVAIFGMNDAELEAFVKTPARGRR